MYGASTSLPNTRLLWFQTLNESSGLQLPKVEGLRGKSLDEESEAKEKKENSNVTEGTDPNENSSLNLTENLTEPDYKPNPESSHDIKKSTSDSSLEKKDVSFVVWVKFF